MGTLPFTATLQRHSEFSACQIIHWQFIQPCTHFNTEVVFTVRGVLVSVARFTPLQKGLSIAQLGEKSHTDKALHVEFQDTLEDLNVGDVLLVGTKHKNTPRGAQYELIAQGASLLLTNAQLGLSQSDHDAHRLLGVTATQWYLVGGHRENQSTIPAREWRDKLLQGQTRSYNAYWYNTSGSSSSKGTRVEAALCNDMGSFEKPAPHGRATRADAEWEGSLMAEPQAHREAGALQTKARELWRWVALLFMWVLQLLSQDDVFQVQDNTSSWSGRWGCSSSSWQGRRQGKRQWQKRSWKVTDSDTGGAASRAGTFAAAQQNHRSSRQRSATGRSGK
eukprot:6097139-Amphidinium_carterae.3